MNGDPDDAAPLYEKAPTVAEQSPGCEQLRAVLYTVRVILSRPMTPMTRLSWVDEYLREKGF